MRSYSVKCVNCGKRNRVPAAAEWIPSCSRCETALPWVVTAKDSNFREVVEESPIPVVVEFEGEECIPCSETRSAIEQLAVTLSGEIKFVRISLNKAPDTALRFNVKGLPVIMLMIRDAVIARVAGAFSEASLKEWLESELGNSILGPSMAAAHR